MKIAIQIPATTPLETFFQFLKDRAIDPIHKDNVDLIADFADKFIVVELKRLANEAETITQNLDIPDTALAPLYVPYQKAKAKFDAEWRQILNGGAHVLDEDYSDPDTIEAPAPVVPPAVAQPSSTVDPDVNKYLGVSDPTPAAPVATATPVKRSGNGHVRGKKRPLMPAEKDQIRADFLALGGKIAEDACKPTLAKMGQDVTIFQVTGFMTYLHSQVAAGILALPDMDGYIEYIKGHRKIWENYNSPKYQALRIKNAKV